MDFNHSAVRSFSDEPKMVGVWHQASFAFDPNADNGKGGKGLYGLLAKGTMFAWAFPEHATALLGEQARSGKVEVSMACIPTASETGRDDNGSYEILHKPVFFTVSLLDVPPADKDAAAQVTEDPDANDDDMMQRLCQPATAMVAVAALKTKEARMDKELITRLEAEKATAVAELATIKALTTKKDED